MSRPKGGRCIGIYDGSGCQQTGPGKSCVSNTHASRDEGWILVAHKPRLTCSSASAKKQHHVRAIYAQRHNGSCVPSELPGGELLAATPTPMQSLCSERKKTILVVRTMPL